MNAPVPPPSASDGDRDDPNSSAVLIPLIISMLLVLLGIGVAVAFYFMYRRRYRVWLAEFTERREREIREEEEKERKEKIGPAWWEVEVGDDDEGSWWGVMTDVEKGWNPVAVTYHSTPSSTSEIKSDHTDTSQSMVDIDPKFVSSTSLSAEEVVPEHTPEMVEMTVLIAMPSPTPSRSRRSSPASSLPSLSPSPTKTGGEEERIEEVWEDELPEVQLATVVIPVTEGRTGR